MEQNATVSPMPGYKDRRTGLMVFGILVIVLGCMVALLIPFMVVGQVMARHVKGMAMTPLRMLAPAMVMYGGLALAFVWLGIGSVLCRRWARALLLVLSWVWLIAGVVGISAMAFILPQVFAHQPANVPPLPPVVRNCILLFTLAFSAVIYVVIPAVLVVFYQSRHVKATCAARDPVRRWTDACPLPVLAVSLLLAFAAAWMPPMIVCFHSVVPFFGGFLSGASGTLVLLVTMAAYLFAARAIYKLNVMGWWVALLGLGLWMISALITFAHADLIQMYALMDFPPAQIDMLRQIGFFQGHWLPVFMVICWLPWIGFLVYTRKYFSK